MCYNKSTSVRFSFSSVSPSGQLFWAGLQWHKSDVTTAELCLCYFAPISGPLLDHPSRKKPESRSVLEFLPCFVRGNGDRSISLTARARAGHDVSSRDKFALCVLKRIDCLVVLCRCCDTEQKFFRFFLHVWCWNYRVRTQP